MIQNAFTGEPRTPPKPTPLAQQQSDVTAEGAPPADNAAQALPITPASPAAPAQPAAGGTGP